MTVANSECALLSLPPELREHIWSYVVTSEEPLIAYLERRTVARPKDDRRDNRTSTITQARRQPLEPSLTAVSVQIRRETLPLYYKTNVFTFNLGGTNWDSAVFARLNLPNQVQEWKDHSIYEVLGFDEYSRSSLVELWTVRLECGMLPLCQEEQDEDEHNERLIPSTLDIRLHKESNRMRLEVFNLTGQLAKECTCWLRCQALAVTGRRRANRTDNDEIIPAFARSVEKRWDSLWVQTGRSYAFPLCQKCGKLCGDGAREGEPPLPPPYLYKYLYAPGAN